MISNSQILRKRAMYTGLSVHLPHEEALEALLLWERKYAGNATFSIRYFVEEVVTCLRADVPSKSLLTSLVAALGAPESDLLADPQRHLDARLTRHTADAIRPSTMPELEAFKLLVSKWLEMAGNDPAREAAEYVARHIHRLALPLRTETQIKSWLADRNLALSILPVEAEELRSVVNLLYTGFCESMGPIKADALLCGTVDRLKNNGGAAYSVVFAKLL